MPNIIGDAVLRVRVAGEKAGKQLEGLRGRFAKMGGAVKNAAGQIPFVGGALTQMLTPAGLATAAIGGLVAGLSAAVGKVRNVEKELRPMIERSGLAGESLQVLTKAAERLGSEDGLEGVTDGSQELQLRLAELATRGSGPAEDAFNELGLSSKELIEASPEESFLAVIKALQGVENEAQRKLLADDLMGGASEKLSGIVNSTADDFNALTASIRENEDIVSNEALASAKDFDDSWRRVKDGVGSFATTVGSALMPILANLIDATINLAQVLKGPLSTGFNFVKDVAKTSLEGVLAIYNNTVALLPGVSEITMEDLSEQWEKLTTRTTESTESIEDFRNRLLETKPAIEETTDALEDAHKAQLESQELYNKLMWEAQQQRTADAQEAYRQQIADFDAKQKEILRLEEEAQREQTLLLEEQAKERERIAKEEADARVEQHERLIAEIKKNVEAEALLSKFRMMTSQEQMDFQEEAYNEGISLLDLLRVHFATVAEDIRQSNEVIADSTEKMAERVLKARATVFNERQLGVHFQRVYDARKTIADLKASGIHVPAAQMAALKGREAQLAEHVSGLRADEALRNDILTQAGAKPAVVYEIHGDATVVEGSQLGDMIGGSEVDSVRRGRQDITP